MVDTDRLAKDLRKHLASLQEQREKLDNDIGRLETALAALGVKRGPGRPKGSKNKGSGRPRKKPNWSPDKRREVSERMKKYWADRRKKAAGKKTKSKAQ